jgi:hypothetical protein
MSQFPIIPKCASKHCGRVATCWPIVRVPAIGIPIPEHDPLIVGNPKFKLCTECYMNFRVGEFLHAKNRKGIKAKLKQERRAAPDFARAYVERGPLS